MLVDLGVYHYTVTKTVIETLKSKVSTLDGKLKTVFENLLADYDETKVIYWLLPFTRNDELFKMVLEAIRNGMLHNYDSSTLEELRIEAVNNFHDNKWYDIENLITLYTFELNNKKHFAEIMV